MKHEMLEEFYEPEKTRLTHIAFEEAGALLGKEVRAALVPTEARDGTPIFLHVMGQSSFTGHGNQGLHPHRTDRLRKLDDEERPVLMAFCEGYGAWHWQWLRILESHGEAKPMGRDGKPPEEWRFGWPKPLFENGGENRPLRRPDSGPPPVPPRDQLGLL
jgi:hypothetical protein